MKKIKVLFMALLLVGAAFSSYRAYQAYTNSQNELLMLNLEALANNESGGRTENNDGYTGWFWHKDWVECEFSARIIILSSSQGYRAGATYKYTAELAAELHSKGVTITIESGGKGLKSYCKDGWSPFCSINECR
jgi:hypothetical protein